jgi:hypothetical protein
MDSSIVISPDGPTVYVGSDRTAKLIMIPVSTNQISQIVQVAKRGDIELAPGP